MYDRLGKVVLKGKVTKGEAIDVSALTEGVYLLQVAGQNIKCVK
jgi:hypothetical protein